jgi:hypothetical protein
MKRNLILTVIGVLALGMAAYAHHSIGATYDVSKDMKIEGKLVQVDFRNPHSFVHLDVTVNGKPERWSVEWGGAGSLTGQGITRSTLKAGDEVTITGNPGGGLKRLKMNTLLRKKDGFGGERDPRVVD